MVKSPLFLSARTLELARPPKADIAVSRCSLTRGAKNGSMHHNKKRRCNRHCNEGIPTRSPRWLLFLWPQQEEQQGPARHFIRVPEFEG